MSHPRLPSVQLLPLNVNGLQEGQKRAALFAVLKAGPWHVIAPQETHHATQAEAAQWCREGAGRTIPVGTPLLILEGDWNCVAEDLDRQPPAWLPVRLAALQQALSLQDAFKCLSATACFQMSVQLQSQTSSCQTIMEWQLHCQLPMHLPAARGFGQCLLP